MADTTTCHGYNLQPWIQPQSLRFKARPIAGIDSAAAVMSSSGGDWMRVLHAGAGDIL